MKTNEELYKEWMSRFDEKNPPHMRDAFEAGMEAARPQWHDLRKDPNDLPPISIIESGYEISKPMYVIFTELGEERDVAAFYIYGENCWLSVFNDKINVIAWMPLPEWKGGAE